MARTPAAHTGNVGINFVRGVIFCVGGMSLEFTKVILNAIVDCLLVTYAIPSRESRESREMDIGVNIGVSVECVTLNG